MPSSWIKKIVVFAMILRYCEGDCVEISYDNPPSRPLNHFVQQTHGIEVSSSPRNQLLTESNQEYARQDLLKKIGLGALPHDQFKHLKIDQLIPHQKYQALTSEELTAVTILWPKNDPLPKELQTIIRHRAKKRNEAFAQYLRGWIYYHGFGAKKNLSKALKWFTLAAENGDANAQFMLASLYQKDKKPKEARNLYYRSAQQGHVGAQYNLGLMHHRGWGGDINYEEARKWFTPAAENGDANAQFMLGYIYHQGRGVKQDFQQARKWYTLAANQGHVHAQNNLGMMNKDGHGSTQDDQEAFRLIQLAALQGLAAAQANLGDLYRDGLGTNKNYFLAIEWYLQAINQKNTFAENRLKSLFQISSEVILNAQIPENAHEERVDLLENLNHMQDYYLYFLGLSGGHMEMRDNFSHNPVFTEACEGILATLKHYQKLLETDLLTPGFLVDCLIPSETSSQEQVTMTLTGTPRPLTSLVSFDSLKKIQEGTLVTVITELSQHMDTAYILLEKIGPHRERVRGMLVSLETLNPKLIPFITPFLEPFLKLKKKSTRTLAYANILNFLKDTHSILQNHLAFAEQLNDRINELILQTTSYRNHLCLDKYPYWS